MKKLLGILVLGFFLSNNLSANELNLRCTYKHIDTKFPMYKVGDDIYLTYDLTSKEYIVTEGYIKHYIVSELLNSYYISYTEIHRLSGERLEKSVEITKEQFQEVKNLDMMNKDEKTFNKIFSAVNKLFYKNKASKKDHYHEKPMWGRMES
jgi:hypothetical protein